MDSVAYYEREKKELLKIFGDINLEELLA